MNTVRPSARRMMWAGRILLSCLVTLCCGAAQEQPASPLGQFSPRTGLILRDEILVRLIQTSSGDLAHDYVSQLALWPRDQVTEGFSRAAEWVMQKARDFGLEQVIIERFPSDGKTEYFGNPTSRQWKVNKGELWVTSPFQIKLTSYGELPMSLAGNSTAADVEAELVDIGAGAEERDYAVVVRGKTVLTSGNPGTIFGRAVTGMILGPGEHSATSDGHISFANTKQAKAGAG